MPAQRWSVGLCVYLSDGGASVVCLYLGDGGAGGPVVDLAAVRRVELERCPRPTEVDALVDGHRVRACRAELQADVRHLHASTCNQTTSSVAMRWHGQWRVNANRGPWQLFARAALLTPDKDLSQPANRVDTTCWPLFRPAINTAHFYFLLQKLCQIT